MRIDVIPLSNNYITNWYHAKYSRCLSSVFVDIKPNILGAKMDTGYLTIDTIGIIIPTYNRVNFLKKSIESILCQTYYNLEVIVIDDCSPDATVDYLKSVTDKRLRFIVNNQNNGLASNINNGISLLSGKVKWCTVLCDDDYYHAECIEELAKTAVSASAAAVIHSHLVFVDRNGQLLRDARTPPGEESAFDFVKSRAEFRKDRYLSGVLFSREHFEAAGGYPVFTSGMAADDALIFTLSLKDRLVYSAQSVAYVRIHDEAESQQVFDIRNHLFALQEYRDYCCNKAYLSGLYDAKALDRLKKVLQIHVRGMNIRLWSESINKLLGSNMPDTHEKARTLYRLGVDRQFHFPLRVRITSYFALIGGVCPERSRMYRRIWSNMTRIQNRIMRLFGLTPGYI